MKKITCPYSWDCGKTLKIKELNKFDFNFVQSAIKKRMIFMLITCPQCSRQFKFNTVQWQAVRFEEPNSNLKVVDKKKKTILAAMQQVIARLHNKGISIQAEMLMKDLAEKF